MFLIRQVDLSSMNRRTRAVVDDESDDDVAVNQPQPARGPDESEGESGSGQEGEPTTPGAEGSDASSAGDSSEDEEDDPEELKKIRDGFIVDSDDEEQDGDSQGRSGGHRRRRRHRPEELEEDDLNLVREAGGSRFKRLKRAEDDGAGATGNSTGGLSHIFDDEEQEETQPRGEFDDFIEDDDFSDEQEERLVGKAPQRQTQRAAGGTRGGLSQFSGLNEDKIGEIYDVFGDGAEYEWALEGEDEAEAPVQETEQLDLRDVFEPSELKNRMLTAEDNKIRAEDVPERYQILRQALNRPYELEDYLLADKKLWIETSMVEHQRLLFAQRPELRAPFKEAVQKVVELVSVEQLEVPFIWHHRQDFLIHFGESQERTQLLTREDLWRIVLLDIDFMAMLEKQRAVMDLIKQVGAGETPELQVLKGSNNSLDYQDFLDYLRFTYSEQLHKDQRRHARFGYYDRLRKDPGVSEVLDTLKLSLSDATDRVEKELTGSPEPKFSESAKPQQACELLAMDLATYPRLRQWFRTQFETRARVSIVITNDGKRKIVPGSPFADIKYAINWSLEELRLRPDLYLRMLRAEDQGLVKVRLQYPQYKSTLFESFTKALGEGEFYQTLAKSSSRLLIPHICTQILENLRSECLRVLSFDVRRALLERMDQAPYKPPGFVAGTTPRVLTISSGEGRIADAAIAVLVDEDGHVVEQAKLGDSKDGSFRRRLVDIVDRRKPDVVGVAGFSPATRRLMHHVGEMIADEQLTAGDSGEHSLECVWVQDEVARLYRESERARTEFPELVPIARYCVALARYLQSPLLEYANLSPELLASIELHTHQTLLPQEQFIWATESAFVDLASQAGVDLSLAVRSKYHAALVPFIAGFGPRKAGSVLEAVQAHGGLVNRSELITKEITSKQIFMNCASFIRISTASTTIDDDHEVLDSTRIHPENYELARKMAADALELDEEDLVALENRPGGVVGRLLGDDEAEKLNDLILEEYADELWTRFGQRKRTTLEDIREELQDPYGELRKPLRQLSDVEVFTMLTGETRDSLAPGHVVSAVVRRVAGRQLILVLSCGIDAVAESGNMSDDRSVPLNQQFSPGNAVQAAVLNVDYKAMLAQVNTRRSVVRSHLAQLERQVRDTADPAHWDKDAERRDEEEARAKTERETRAGRIIKHPLFRAFSAKQAEEFLAPLQRGDLVIRPSSRGMDHLAITWKVADMIYQHIDVLELDKPNEFALGRRLRIGRWEYTDLDELIIMHVQAMARKVDEMCQHEKFQAGSKADVEKWLSAYTAAQPKRSVYAFCFDHRHPGWFLLCFKTGASSSVKEWHVKVIPNGFELQGNAYPDVSALCNGFKLIFQSLQR